MTREQKIAIGLVAGSLAAAVVLAVSLGLILARPTSHHMTVTPTTRVVPASSKEDLVLRSAWAQIDQSDRDGVCSMFNIDQDTAMSMIVDGMDNPPPTETLRSFLEGEC